MNAPLNPILAAILAEADPIKALKGERRTVAVNQLDVSEYNVRTVETDVTELAALIYSAGGVIENLVVHEILNKRGKPSGRFGVVAGGRRRRACLLLVEQGKMSEDFEVPVLVVDEEQAEALSLAENSGRAAMHPVDEFVAFAKLVKAGRSVEAVAAAYGVGPLVVKRRLKLANVAPRFLDMCKAGQIDLNILMALALTDDHATQIAVWDGAQNYERTAHHIRAKLTAAEVDGRHNKLALFVGAEAFEAAGGIVRTDLFSEALYFNDPVLLETLAIAKLEAEAERLKGEGWGWVEILPSLNWEHVSAYQRAERAEREPTPEEAAAIAAKEKEAEDLNAKMDDIDYDSEEGDDEADRLNEQIEAIEAELDTMREALLCAAADKSALGVLIAVEHNGKLGMREGMLRKGERVAEDGSVNRTQAAGESGEVKAKPVHSQSLTAALTAHRTAAMQAALMARPDVALVAVVREMVARSFYVWEGRGPLKLSSDKPALQSSAADIDESAAKVAINAQRELWRERMPNEASELFAWLMLLPQHELVTLLAVATCDTIDAVTQWENSRNEPADELCGALALDMADWWQPTAANYLGKVSRDRIIAVVGEAVSPEAAQRLSSHKKKAELVAAAELELAGRRWIPELMRLPQ